MAADPASLTIKAPLQQRQQPVSLPERSRGNWFAEQRLRFIEARLFWVGRINRADLMDHFQIHRSVASADFSDYQRLAPCNAIYDRREKVYRAGKSFIPLFVPPSLPGLLGHALLGDAVPASDSLFEWVRPLERAGDPVVARNVIAAARNSIALKIFYRSLEHPEGQWRWVEPHALISDGQRWHARAYCHTRQGFRDFVLSRIDHAEESRPGVIDAADDLHWHEIVEFSLRPHSALRPAQAELVARDYPMVNNELPVRCRRALLWYLLVNLGLDNQQGPPRQVLELSNPAIRGLAGFRNPEHGNS